MTFRNANTMMLFVFALMTAAATNMMDVDLGTGRDSASNQGHHQKTFDVALDSKGLITMTWWLEMDAEVVHFRIEFDGQVQRFAWFAMGFSDYGEMENADVVLLKTEPEISLTDMHADSNGILIAARRQDYHKFSWNPDRRILTFSRKFDTCDDEKYIIEDGTTHIVWAIGSSPMPSLNSGYADRSMVRVQLVKNPDPHASMPESVKKFEVTVKDYAVPSADTTYYCTIHKLPDWLTARNHHLIRYESKISKGSQGVVHHMEVFYCDAPATTAIDSYAGSCLDEARPANVKLCSRVRAAWAMGAGPFVYPKEAGVPLGGPDTNRYVMLEVHYNNPQMRAGIIDNSGIALYLTPELRKYEASIMELGLTYVDKMMIPPNQGRFTLTGECISECTEAGIPRGGIVVFGSQLHTHLTGTKVRTRHFRNGLELKPLNVDNHYSTHFQEIRLLKKPVYILPGDFLKTECVYNTKVKNNITFGGHSIQDEMCVNYIHYYPSGKLEVCKSAVSTNSLTRYFKRKNQIEGVSTHQDKSIRENFNAISPWNANRVAEVKNLFNVQPIDMECHMPSGQSFPGVTWEDLRRDVVLMPLQKQPRRCNFTWSHEL